MTLNITDAELHEWAKLRADDAGRLARELVACRLQAQAAIAAAYEAAAEMISEYPHFMLMTPDQKKVCIHLAQVIRALATPDQIAALAAERATTVTVKPLVWKPSGFEGNRKAGGLGLGYFVEHAARQFSCSVSDGRGCLFKVLYHGASEEAAKAAAQADYDARIRSAITITSEDAEITRLRAVIAKDAAQMIEDQHKLHKAVEALRFYANGENWMINGPLDGNSGNYTGGPAKAVLAEIGGA